MAARRFSCTGGHSILRMPPMVVCLSWLAKPLVRHVWFGSPPPRTHFARSSPPPEDRVAMLQALLAGNADAEIDQRELQRGGPSYFVDTLRSFRAEDESTPLRFLIGADQALQFRRWHNWEQILDLAHPVIARPPRSVGLGTGARTVG